MIDHEVAEFLHSGCALIVGMVAPDGRPHGSRGFGLTVVDPVGGRVRVLIDADDARTVELLQPGAAVAVTAAAVPTLRSFQLKGRVVSVEPLTDADRAKQRQYTDDFVRDIHETDGDPLEILLRWTDRRAMACTVDIDATFDQTPGPSAGVQVGGPTA